METSKAAVFVGPLKPLEIRDFAVPEVGPGAVLVQMQMAAVCGSDIHRWHNPDAKGPMILGHENVGVVAQMCAGVTTDAMGQALKEGDRIVFRAAPCGRCYECTVGLTCRATPSYGMVSSEEFPHITGGFSEYLYLEPHPWVLRIPDDMSDERAMLAVVGNHTVLLGLEKMDGIRTGDTVVIQGSGPIGMGALIQTRLMGAGRIVVVGAPANRLRLAAEMGADDTVDLADYPSPESRVERVKELVGPGGADVVIECAGATTSVQEGLEMARRGAKYLVIGQTTDRGAQSINPFLIARKGLRIEGVIANNAPFGYIARSVTTMNQIVRYPVEKLITHRFALPQINDAFKTHESYDCMISVVLPNE